jgi:hypothetical protein
VDWLAPSDAVGALLTDETLIASLAANEDARLRGALTGLFLLHPKLASEVPNAIARLTQPSFEAAEAELAARYMAAVYLQNLWRTKLQRYLGNFPDLRDLYSEKLELPTAQEGFGKTGLVALAEWHARQTSAGYNRLAEYNQIIEHVFASLKLRAQRHASAS